VIEIMLSRRVFGDAGDDAGYGFAAYVAERATVLAEGVRVRAWVDPVVLETTVKVRGCPVNDQVIRTFVDQQCWSEWVRDNQPSVPQPVEHL
jgi:hypothetical protein